MEPSDWISLAALGFAAVALIVSTIVAPFIAARIERNHHVRDRRNDVYTDTVRLLRARMTEIEHASMGDVEPSERGPDEDEEAAITASLLIYASDPVWRQIETFFKTYWAASMFRLSQERARSRGQDDPAARIKLADIHDRMRVIVDNTVNLMRGDLAISRLPIPQQRPAQSEP